MGGRWSLVQIQSPRPFSSAWPLARAPGLRDPAPPAVRPARQPRGGTDMMAWVGYRMADLVVRVLPASLADRLCVALARLMFHARLPARRAQEANLARLLGGVPRAAIRARARESFEHFALALTDFLRLDSMDPAALGGAIEIRGAEHLEAARAAGRGVILVSAHLGNWEW